MMLISSLALPKIINEDWRLEPLPQISFPLNNSFFMRKIKKILMIEYDLYFDFLYNVQISKLSIQFQFFWVDDPLKIYVMDRNIDSQLCSSRR